MTSNIREWQCNDEQMLAHISRLYEEGVTREEHCELACRCQYAIYRTMLIDSGNKRAPVVMVELKRLE